MPTGFKSIVGFLLLVTLMGAGHGIWTDRWVRSQELQQSLTRLERFPKDLGDWRGEEIAFEQEDMDRNGIRGCVFRKYRNIRTGATVSVLLVCGRGGPISVHTPDVCYTAAGYQQTSAQERAAMGESLGDFWKSYFSLPNAVVPKRLEIFWAWSRDGFTWSAPENPRYSFARYPALYKMYIVRETPAQSKVADETSKEFLGRMLPELRTAFGNPP